MSGTLRISITMTNSSQGAMASSPSLLQTRSSSSQNLHHNTLHEFDDEEARILLFVREDQCPTQRHPRQLGRDYDASAIARRRPPGSPAVASVGSVHDGAAVIEIPVHSGCTYYISLEAENAYAMNYQLATEFDMLMQPSDQLQQLQIDAPQPLLVALDSHTKEGEVVKWNYCLLDMQRTDMSLLITASLAQSRITTLCLHAQKDGLPTGLATEYVGTNAYRQESLLSYLVLAPKELTRHGAGRWYVGLAHNPMLALAEENNSSKESPSPHVSVSATLVDTCTELQFSSAMIYSVVPQNRWTYLYVNCDDIPTHYETYEYSLVFEYEATEKLRVCLKKGSMPSLLSYTGGNDYEASMTALDESPDLARLKPPPAQLEPHTGQVLLSPTRQSGSVLSAPSTPVIPSASSLNASSTPHRTAIITQWYGGSAVIRSETLRREGSGQWYIAFVGSRRAHTLLRIRSLLLLTSVLNSQSMLSPSVF